MFQNNVNVPVNNINVILVRQNTTHQRLALVEFFDSQARSLRQGGLKKTFVVDLLNSMQSRTTVPTEIGVLWGRDCIFLDRVSMPDIGTLQLQGTINADIVRKFCPPEGWTRNDEIPYVFLFHGCLAHQLMELDTWDSQNNDHSAFLDSTFQELGNSNWLSRLAGKLDPNHRHFQLATYDDVFEIICRSYTLAFGPPLHSTHT